MTSTRTGAHTETFREQYGSSFTGGLTAATQAAIAGDSDPTVVLLRAAARLLGDDVWIAVKLPD